MRLYDAHNHLQDARLAGHAASIVPAARAAGVERMVVNGTAEDDWPALAALAGKFPETVVPSFGLHPWHLHKRTARWEKAMNAALDVTPGAVIGEIGLDRWILQTSAAVLARHAPVLGATEGSSFAEQATFFLSQLRIARERCLPVSIHCLRAWMNLYGALLYACPLPKGFLLHSYGGPADLVGRLTKLGAYFSFPGYFLHARKARQREAFKLVPAERLLVETDAPDQLLPDELNRHPLHGVDGRALNHPANLAVTYEGLAALRGMPVEELAGQVEDNFRRLFGGA